VSGRSILEIALLGITAVALSVWLIFYSSTRDQARTFTESEVQLQNRLFCAITVDYGIENDGKYPPSTWNEIQKYVGKRKIPESFLSRCVYNAVSAGSSKYPGDRTPILVVRDEQKKRLTVIYYDGNRAEISIEKIEKFRPSFTDEAWRQIQQL